MTGVLVTTSHKPSQRTRSFVKDLANILPGSKTITRGKKTLNELSIETHRQGSRYFIVVGERRGNPSLIRIYRVEYAGRIPGYRLYASIVLRGVTLSRENPEAMKTYGVETIGFEEKCVSDKCYQLLDILYTIFKDKVVEKPDVEILLVEDKRGYILVKPLNKLGRIAGPLIRVRNVERYE